MRAERGPGAARWIIGVVLGVVALNAILAALNSAFRNPGGPTSSSYATGPDGLAAFAELLARSGHPVGPLRGPLDEANLDPSTTLVVLDPAALAPDDIARLKRFAANGGRLLIGGRFPSYVDGLLSDPPEWSGAGSFRAEPLAPIPETAGVEEVETAGEGAWVDVAGALPAMGTEDEALLAIARQGSGRLLLIADPSPLQNALIARRDNAAFALALAGEAGRAVVFAEGVHGYGDETGLRALPWRWRFALVGVVVAAVVWMIAKGRRLGPPEESERALPPPRKDYVDALAATLARTQRRDEAIAPVRAAARALVVRRAGLRPDVDDATLSRAARAQGLDAAAVQALVERAGSDVDVIAVGRALAHLNREGVER